jgi:hypothetical protein
VALLLLGAAWIGWPPLLSGVLGIGLLALFGLFWRGLGYGAESSGIFAIAAALLAGLAGLAIPQIGLAVLWFGAALAAGRAGARQAIAQSGETDLVSMASDIMIVLWNVLDQFSFKLKPFLATLAWAAALAVLLPGWNIGQSLWLGSGLGLGLWFGEGRWQRALLLPALGGAVGGWFAGGWERAVLGALLGAGIGLGEWLEQRMQKYANSPIAVRPA